jgi:dTDP-4-amino-4,6-dideoxygalactose transaminase
MRKFDNLKQIQLFQPLFRIDESLNEIKECLEKGWTGIGYKTNIFEEKWKEYTNFPFAHFLNSATAGLHLSIKIFKDKLGWKEGDEIITTPLTFVSTNHAILYENLTPIFADVDEYLSLSPESVESNITSKTKAVMFVGMGGNVGRFLEIKDICRKYNLILILDAAHMGGTKWTNGTHVGSEADATVFSFQAVKNLPSSDSGMICFQDAELDKTARQLSWLGIDKDTYSRFNNTNNYSWYYEVEQLGFKYHGNSITASLCIVALKYLDFDNECRRKLASLYDSVLRKEPSIQLVPINPLNIPSRHLYQVLVEDRDNVILQLKMKNIFPGVHYRDNTEYKIYRYAANTCPNAKIASSKLLSLPLHLNLKEDEVMRVAETLIQICQK